MQNDDVTPGSVVLHLDPMIVGVISALAAARDTTDPLCAYWLLRKGREYIADHQIDTHLMASSEALDTPRIESADITLPLAQPDLEAVQSIASRYKLTKERTLYYMLLAGIGSITGGNSPFERSKHHVRIALLDQQARLECLRDRIADDNVRKGRVREKLREWYPSLFND